MNNEELKKLLGYPPYHNPDQSTPPPDAEKTFYELAIVWGLTDKDRGLIDKDWGKK